MRLEIPVGERSIVLETGKLARQAGGAVTASLGDTVLLSTATRSAEPAPGAHVLAPERGHRGADDRGGQDPRRLPQARGQAFGQGDPDLPAYGQAPQAAVPQELPLRDTGHRHRPRRRPGHALRHREHGRGLRGARALGPAVRRSDRGRARRALAGRRVHPEPDLRPDRRERPRPRRGGDQRSHHHGRGGGQRGARDRHGRGAAARPGHRAEPGRWP